MKKTFKKGDKVKCVYPTGFLVRDKIYTVYDVGISNDIIYLEESTFPSHYYLSGRFDLYIEAGKTFDEQLAYAQSLNGKVVEYGGDKLTVQDIFVFIKGFPNDKSSVLVRHELIDKEWCIAVCGGGRTIPLNKVKLISVITIKNVGAYEAIVHKDYVEVGCQKISKEKFEEIAKAFKDLE